jgi:recombination protein RecA
MSAAAQDVRALLARIGSPSKLRLSQATDPKDSARPLILCWPGLEEVLPDGGLPCGVVELTAARALGGATSLALAAVRAGQARAREAWCAWVDPEATLHAPGVVAAGVDLTRLLYVTPPRVGGADSGPRRAGSGTCRAGRADLARTAVKVVASGAFEVVVIDVDAVGGVRQMEGKRTWAPEVLVRKLALLAEPSGTTVLLLTDSTRPRSTHWPVSLRLELSRPSRLELSVRVAKDRRGRIGTAKTLPFRPAVSALAGQASALAAPDSALVAQARVAG